MNRMIVASKQAIRVTFSHGQIRLSSAPISRFFCTNSEKKHYWLRTKKHWSNKHGATPLFDHLQQSINQERELHEQKEPHTDISVDDEFEELGPNVTSSPKTNFRSLLEVPQKERKSFGMDGSDGNENVSMMNHKGKDGNVKIGFGTADLVSVAIDKVPLSVNSGQLRDAMRAFGEVKNALSVTSGNNGLGSYHVEFKNRESKERALRAGEVTIGKNALRINDIKTPRLLRIRIDKVDSAMPELAIHSKFSSCGHVAGLISTNDGEIDVFFQVDGEIEVERIVNKVDKKWTREVELLQPKTPANSTYEKNEMHFERMVGEMRKRLELQRIYLEDLEHLHSAISHIKTSLMHVRSTHRDERASP